MTSTDIVVPTTGEVVSLDDAEQCARVLSEIRQIEQHVRDLKAALRQALLEYSRTQGTKTMHFAGMKVQVSTPSRLIWDHDVLLELRDAGLPESRFDELVTMEVTYKVNKSVANAIAASNPEYAEIIERACTNVPKEPNVTIK
jgi:hypothetical protein